MLIHFLVITKQLVSFNSIKTFQANVLVDTKLQFVNLSTLLRICQICISSDFLDLIVQLFGFVRKQLYPLGMTLPVALFARSFLDFEAVVGPPKQNI